MSHILKNCLNSQNNNGYGIFYSPCIGCAETGRVACPNCGADGVVE
ncbi:MAG: hypothetical protein PUF26_06900 [Bacteroidales bacterium]|nr:hypothetical protein [Bacteroidales bacterium]